MSNCLSMLENIKYVSYSAKNGVFSEKNITMFTDYLADDFSICYLTQSNKSNIDPAYDGNNFKIYKSKANLSRYTLSFGESKEVCMRNYILYSKESEDKIISFMDNICSIIEDKQNILFSKIKKEMESQRWSLLH